MSNNQFSHEDIAKLREVEVAHLEELSKKYFRAACAGDVKSGEMLLKLSERRAKLLGLDAPIQTQLEVITYDSNELIKQYEILKRAAISSGQDSME
ncbi:MAG: hypothetical protein F2933_03990 [Actinobacteria bacterium]|nr:hypothetical protein [Actinomycetota bacterium]